MTASITAAPSPRNQFAGLLAGVFVVLAAGLAMLSVSAPREPSSATEGAFLAFVSCSALLLFLPLAVRSGPRVLVAYSLAPLLATLVVWGVPAGPARGSAVSLVLAALPLLLCGPWSVLWRANLPSLPGLPADAVDREVDFKHDLDLGAWIPAAVGIQLLLRMESLWPLDPTLQRLVTWLVLPTAAIFATSRLANRHGRHAATLTLLATVVVCGGFTVHGVLALACLAAAGSIAETRLSQWRRVGLSVFIVLVALALFWDPAPGLVLLLGSLVFARVRGWAAFLLVGAGVLALATTSRSWGFVLDDLLLWALLLPVAPLVVLSVVSSGVLSGVPTVIPSRVTPGISSGVSSDQGAAGARLGTLAACLVLTVVALRAVEPVEALAMPSAILLLTWFGFRPRSAEDLTSLSGSARQASSKESPSSARWAWATGAWLSLLLFAQSIAAGYPWFRWPSLEDTLIRLGAHQAGLRSAAFFVVLVALAWCSRWGAAGDRQPGQRAYALSNWVGGLATWVGALGRPVLVLATAVLIAQPYLGSRVLLDWPGIELDRERPSFSVVLPAGSPAKTRLLLDSALSHSGSVAPGVEALEISVRRADPEQGTFTLTHAILRLGADTGEWAAARDNTAAPAPWLSWIVPLPSNQRARRFFGQQYRSVVDLGPLAPGATLVVSLGTELPETTTATLYRLALVLQPGRGDRPAAMDRR